MVFDNIFKVASKGAGHFSVTTHGTKPQPGAGVDFEDAADDTYDDTTTSLFTNAIHGASSRAKVVREQSPEARVILGFLGSFIETTRTSAEAQQGQGEQHASSVSAAAATGMNTSSSTVTDRVQKNPDLEDTPSKDKYSKPPKAPETPKAPEAPAAPKATAEKPSRSE